MSTADAVAFAPRSALFRYALPFAAVAIVFAFDTLLDTLIDDGSHLLLLGWAVLATAWFAGSGPALAATVAAAILGAWDARSATEAAAWTRLAIFTVHGVLVTALVSELHHARSAAEREAQKSQRESEVAASMKEQFLATISHELRTPLNAVLGWVYLLRTGKLDAETSVRGLESIERNARAQAQLTGDLLDVSRILTGQLRLDSVPVPVGDTLRGAIVAALPIAQANGVTIESHIPNETLSVLGDANRLRQVAWHLLANAIKFTPRGGSIDVRLESSDNMAILTVSDSGPGIAAEFLPHVFDRFTQGDRSPGRATGGLGIGLFLVHDLVELHGGDVRVRNKRPDEGGTGAIFTVRLPLHVDGPGREAPSILTAGTAGRALDNQRAGMHRVS